MEMIGSMNRQSTGEADTFFDADFLANPYPKLAHLREEGPVVPLNKLFGRQLWLVTRYDEAVSVLKDQRFSVNWRQLFSSPVGWIAGRMAGMGQFDLSQSMIGVDEPDHSRLRSLVSKAFTPRFIEGLRPRIQSLADELLDQVQDRGEMDLVNGFAYPLPINVISDMLGIPEGERDDIKRWSQSITGASMGTRDPDRRAQLAEFAAYVRRLAAEKRKNPGDDLISQLVQTEGTSDRLSEQELFSMITLLIFAGHETTSNLIGLGTLALLDHPDQFARLKANPGLIPGAVEEMLRFATPVTSPAPRFAMEDVEVGGQRIRKGEGLVVLLSSANRDHSQFVNAEEMNLTREENKHIAFGQGIHYCLGAPLARLEGDIAFTTLLERMPNLHLNIPRDQVQWRGAMNLRGLVSLPVAF
jgi:cytochrome P450